MKKNIYGIAVILTGLALSSQVYALKADAEETHAVAAGTYENEDGSGNRFLDIGSVSKMYAVTAVMQLADEGKVDIDAPVYEYIPDFKMADERYKDITVRMLMNHTSGLMGTAYGNCFLFNEAQDEYHDSFLKHLETQRLKADPGAFNCYCNDGFTLLEILVERVGGESFTDYIEENICRPLSLDNTGSIRNMDINNQAPIYVNGNVKMEHECAQLIGAGGIMSDASDVCTFGTAFFTGNEVLLSEKAKSEIAKNNRTGGRMNYGLGWDSVLDKDYDEAGVTVLSKGGDTFCQHAGLLVAPDEQISVAVLSSAGNSGLNEEIAKELLDIALLDRGIKVEHPEEEKPELLDTVPDRFLSYEGVYADATQTVRISFPDKRYMQVTTLTSERESEDQFMYAKDGSFVKMSGDVASGKAIPQKPMEALYFDEVDGCICLTHPDYGCILYKAPETDVDEKIQRAWDERDGATYYYVSGRASDMCYMNENRSYTLHTDEAAKGYVNGCVMLDADHAGYETILPGEMFRDISNIRMETVDGKEYLCLDDLDCRYISEKCIPVFSEDITSAELKSGEACWYKLEGAKDMTLSLDIPENASVYVFDSYKNLKYSSYMTDYGNKVPLPENGMIVFAGESGSRITVDAIK